MEGYFLWEESLRGVGSCLSCLICLRAFWLFSGSSCKHTLENSHSCTQVASHFVTEFTSAQLFSWLREGSSPQTHLCVSSDVMLSSLTVASTCLSDYHNLASDWLSWLAQAEFFCTNFLSICCEFLYFWILLRWKGALLCCWVFIIWKITPVFQILTLLHLSLVARQPPALTSSSQPYYGLAY